MWLLAPVDDLSQTSGARTPVGLRREFIRKPVSCGPAVNLKLPKPSLLQGGVERMRLNTRAWPDLGWLTILTGLTVAVTAAASMLGERAGVPVADIYLPYVGGTGCLPLLSFC